MAGYRFRLLDDIETAELVYVQTRPAWTLSGSLFRNRISNIVRTIQVVDSDTRAYRAVDDNSGEWTTNGLELIGELRPLPALNLSASGSGEESPEDKAAREQIAAAFILQWKINRALYQQYGGRIIFQQGGPEPLDAYRQFLEEKEKQGAFGILEKSFEPAFWRYFRTDSIHSFYPAGSKEESQAFATPWWLMEQPEEVQ